MTYEFCLCKDFELHFFTNQKDINGKDLKQVHYQATLLYTLSKMRFLSNYLMVVRWGLTSIFISLLSLSSNGLYAQSIDVLHWWTSSSESKAAEQLKLHLANQGVYWNDTAIAGGGGVAAVKVLKSRILMGDAPDVAQIIGPTLNEWSDSGVVLPLNKVIEKNKLEHSISPTVLDLITYKHKIIAAPLGVHRINTLLYNKSILDKLNVAPPKTWADIELLHQKLKGTDIQTIAWSDEPWQINTAFEALLLSEAGPKLYLELMQKRETKQWMQEPVLKALNRLQWMRNLSANQEKASEKIWTQNAKDLAEGKIALLLMGDWAKGELMSWGYIPNKDFGCTPVPATANSHLYSIDTLALLIGHQSNTAVQEKFVETVTSVPAQLSYNKVKGSVPVRRDIDSKTLDVCAKDSLESFNNPKITKVPSLAHRMVADEATKDAIAYTLWRSLTADTSNLKETQIRLAAIIRSADNKK